MFIVAKAYLLSLARMALLLAQPRWSLILPLHRLWLLQLWIRGAAPEGLAVARYVPHPRLGAQIRFVAISVVLRQEGGELHHLHPVGGHVFHHVAHVDSLH